MVTMKYPKYLNIKASYEGGNAAISVESDADNALVTIPLVSIYLHSVIERTDLSKDELMDMISSTMDRLETTEHLDVGDMH